MPDTLYRRLSLLFVREALNQRSPVGQTTKVHGWPELDVSVAYSRQRLASVAENGNGIVKHVDHGLFFNWEDDSDNDDNELVVSKKSKISTL
jgi:hypothetical protein